MKAICLLLVSLFSLSLFAQNSVTVLRGSVYGTRPDTTSMVRASKLEAFMGNKTRITTALKGMVLRVTKQKGGWFELDAGKGKVIAAHFKNYSVVIPNDLKGHMVILEGVAQKQFIADDQQHFAGDTVNGKKQQNVKTNPKRKLTFEVSGLLVR